MNLDFWIRRLAGKRTCVVERGARLASTARIRNMQAQDARIRVGMFSLIAGELLIFAHGGQISLGQWCFVGEGTRIWSSCSITIGNRVLISHNVNVFDSLTHPLNASSRHEQFKAIMVAGHPRQINLGERPVVLEDDVWIGAGASVLRGVTVRTGAVVATGAVVTKEVPPYVIVAGNPARIIRELRVDER